MFTKQAKKGSALIIAVLLVTAIGGIAFAFGRVLSMSSANASIHENRVGAFYAAESGLEEGFLRYRFDRNSEVPFTGYSLKDTSQVYRNNLTASLITKNSDGSGISKFSADGMSTAAQIYDLRMGYIGMNNLPFYGQDADLSSQGQLNSNDLLSASYGTGNNSILSIAKDESIKIDLSKMDLSNGTNDLKLLARIFKTGSTDTLSLGNALIEAKLVVNQLNEVTEYKVMLGADPSAACAILSPASTAACKAQFLSPIYGVTSQRLNTADGYIYFETSDQFLSDWRLRDQIPAFDSNTKATLYLKPLYHNLRLGLVSNLCLSGINGIGCDGTKTTVVTGPYTTVTSTGLYGGVTRTLEAKIDRQSGTLYDLFDYVIYKAT